MAQMPDVRASAPPAAGQSRGPRQPKEYAELAKLIACIRGIVDKYGMSSATSPAVADYNTHQIVRALAAILKQRSEPGDIPAEARGDQILDMPTALARIEGLKEKVRILSDVKYSLQQTLLQKMDDHPHIAARIREQDRHKRVLAQIAASSRIFCDQLEAGCNQRLDILSQRLHAASRNIQEVKVTLSYAYL